MNEVIHPLLRQQLQRALGLDTVSGLLDRFSGHADSAGLARLLLLVSERYLQVDGDGDGHAPAGDRAPAMPRRLPAVHDLVPGEGADPERLLQTLRDSVRALMPQLPGAAHDDGPLAELDALAGLMQQNLHQRVDAERRLADGERQFHSLVAHIPGCVYRRLNDASPTMLFVSDAIIDAIGWPPSAFVQEGRSLARQVHPQDRPMLVQAVNAAVQARTSFDIHYRYRHRDGTQRWANERGRGVYDDAGRLLYLDGVLFDRTASELARQQLSESRQHFLDAVESLDVGVLMMGQDDRLIICNRKYRSWHPGYEHMLVPGTTSDDVMRAIYRSSLDDPTQNQGEQDWMERRLEQRQRLRDGPLVREVEVNGQWFRLDDSRTPNGVTISLRTDITQMKQVMRDLERARDHAEAASHAKTRFLANMSHELRTPLNAVIGAAQLMKAGEQTLEQREYLADAIERSGSNLLGLIDNILDLSRIESGKLTLVSEDFHLIECVDAAMTTVALGAREKGLALACIVEPELACWRRGDAGRLRQVLLNLLGNAVKFTQRGEVVLRVSAGARAHALQFRIADTGVGIDAASLAHVFEPFRQGDEGSDRRFGGSGLGLAIVHQLVQAMGGQIEVRSTSGAGACFDLTLQLPTVPDPAGRVPPLGLRVAYLEPHAASAEALHKLLLRMGCEPQCCDDLRELRQWCRQPADVLARSWLLACTDAPGSAALMAQARQLLDPCQVIGMSCVESRDARSDPEAAATLRARSVIKPVSRSVLASRFAAAARGPGRAADVAVPPSLATTVLVVEDDPLNQTIVCELLRHAGYSVSAVSNGMSAIEALSKVRYGVVLMDWQMPDLDGLEVTRRLRAGAAGDHGQQVPIVALTANAFAEDREACLAAGMNDFLSKPVLAASLVAAVRRWGRPAAAAADPGPDWGSAAASQPPAQLLVPVFDPSVLASLPMVADGSQPDYPAELLRMFIESVPATLATATVAHQQGDALALRRAVHTVKSTSATVGALALARCAALAEDELREGVAVPDALLQQLQSAFETFTLALADRRTSAQQTGQSGTTP